MNTNKDQFLDEDGMNKLVTLVAQKISELYVLKSKYDTDIAELQARITALEESSN